MPTIDPFTIAVVVAVLLSVAAVFMAGYLYSRQADYMVDMREIANYNRHVNANQSLQQDVQDTENK